MCSYYFQQGFQIVFIKGDGEFAPLKAWMAMVYGAPKLNLASANEHAPEIERKIRVIKEWVRAIIYSIPFNSLPARMLVHCDKTTESVSRERWTVVKNESEADYVGQSGPL
jgi:hypothetical protein